jgi:hypothetical protein
MLFPRLEASGPIHERTAARTQSLIRLIGIFGKVTSVEIPNVCPPYLQTAGIRHEGARFPAPVSVGDLAER